MERVCSRGMKKKPGGIKEVVVGDIGERLRGCVRSVMGGGGVGALGKGEVRKANGK